MPRGVTALVLALVPVLLMPAFPAASAGPAGVHDPCADHFPLLRAALASPGPGKLATLPSPERAALERELRIEQALWQDEVEHQRERLGSEAKTGSEIGSEAVQRLDEVATRVSADLAALEEALAAGTALPERTLGLLAACSELHRASPGEPLSARFDRIPASARLRPELTGRRAPEGYLDPPSDELRAAAEKARASRADAKSDQVSRPDPVAAKVAELSNDPVALYAFVLDQIRPAAYVGSMRGPASTLRAGEGNDADQAALLAGLLRAAGYSTRVVWGVQEIPTEALLAHYGRSSFAELERDLTQIGVPFEPVLAGGRPRAYLINRAWCEVWIPFDNYRGVVLNGAGPMWLALDPFMKTVGTLAPGSVLDDIGFMTSSFVDGYLGGNGCGPDLSQPLACSPPRDLISAEVDTFLAGRGSSFAAASAPVAIGPSAGKVLPSAMVGKIVEVHGFGFDYEPGMQHRIRFIAREGERVLLDTEVPVSALAGKEAMLWFVPATIDDQAVALAYRGLWRAPAYLVNVSLQLRADGEELVRAEPAIGMGRAFELEVVLTAPDGSSIRFADAMRAGVPAAFGIAPGEQGYETVYDEPASTSEVMSALADEWLGDVARLESELARLAGEHVVHRFPTVVVLGSVVSTRGTLGLIERLVWEGAFLDADVHGSELTGSDAERRRWLELVELEASARERELFESHGSTSVSADKALVMAARQGMTIHHITSANLGVILPTLPFDQEVLAEIEGWVVAGGEAWVPAGELSLLEWTGVGYRLLDPATGAGRYQLTGRLSGAMIAAPWFTVSDDIRYPMQYPSTDYTNPDPGAAIGLVIFDGNLQVGETGEVLSDANGSISLKLLVTDMRDRPVKGAEVQLEVLAGHGGFGGPGQPTTTATSNMVGIVEVPLTLGTDTTNNPYYLLFPDDDYATRCDLSVITATVNGRQMPDVFWEMARPGEVTQLLAPRGTSTSALPHTSAPDPLVAVPVDQYDNPVSNVDVTYTLAGSQGQNGEGPELLGRLDKEGCKTGTIVAGECPGASTVKTETGGISGTWTYLVVGDSTHTVTASVTTDSGQVTRTYTGTARTSSVPGGYSVGWPSLLVAGRSQPVNASGEIIEAYAPGATSLPLDVSMIIVREDFTVRSCGSSRWCSTPSGTYTAKRLSTSAVPSCAPDGCGSGTLEEHGQVHYSMGGPQPVDVTISSQNGEGQYTTTVTAPTSPGRYPITAAPTIWVAVPRIPNDPDEPDEIVPCPDASSACGAKLEIMEVSSSSWETEFVIWTVQARMTPVGGPLPVVNLGHAYRHEDETTFTYEVLPETYPALDTTVMFLEDGQIAMQARAAGRGPGQAILPVGKLFSDPMKPHHAMVSVNRGWVWQLFPGEPTSMELSSEQERFVVLHADLDIDADNDDGELSPDRNDLEDYLEDAPPFSDPAELPPGKLIFVNHNDDDGSQVPDYAEYHVEHEQSMVPIMVEVGAEAADWAGLELTFVYDGPTRDQLPVENYQGDELGFKRAVNWDEAETYRYADYEPVKVGRLRIWHTPVPEAERVPADYIAPNEAIPASQLGLSPSQPLVKLWVEAINGAHRGEPLTEADIQLEVRTAASPADDPARDRVLLQPVEGNIGVNNSNLMRQDSNGNLGWLRVGVPDVDFDIDEHDELVEDQGDGFRFWRSGVDATYNMDINHVEDLAPMIVEIPQQLVDADVELAIGLIYSGYDEIVIAPATEYSLRAEYLRDMETAKKQVKLIKDSGRGVYEYGSTRLDEIGIELEDTNELVFFLKSQGGAVETIRSAVVQLKARPRDTRHWTQVDSFRLTFAPIDSFYAAYSGRGNDTDDGATVEFDYPTEPVEGDYKIVRGRRFPDAYRINGVDSRIPMNSYGHRLRTAVVNTDIQQYLIFLHGYNVAFADALGWGRDGYKRLYWVGYRGNLVLFTWRGNPTPMMKFGLANHWGLQTSETLRLFMTNVVYGHPDLGGWGADPNNVNIAAHSLGNLVVYDAMRLNMARPRAGLGGSGSRLFRTFISIEAAVWGETFWPQAPVQYCPDGASWLCEPILYSERDLNCSSWTYWFNQRDQEASRSATNILHSYSPGDNVLTDVMRMSEVYVRQGASNTLTYDHYDRPQCQDGDQFRVPWTPVAQAGQPDYSENPGLDFGEWWGRRGCPAMLNLDCRNSVGFCGLHPVWTHIIMPLGAAPHPLLTMGPAPGGVFVSQINAMDYDWNDGGNVLYLPNLGGGHGNCKDESFPDIYAWWRHLTRVQAVPMEMEMGLGQ